MRQALMYEGADVNMSDVRVDPPESCCELTGDCRQDDTTLLMYAAGNGEVEALIALINCKASLDLKDEATHT